MALHLQSLRYRSVLFFLAAALISGVFPVHNLYAAGITISHGALPDIVEIGGEYRLPIIVSGADMTINALALELLADPDALAITDMEILPAFCEAQFVITSVIDTQYGIAYQSCGTSVPAHITNGTIIGYVTVTALSVTPASLTFGAHSALHLHDGLGTTIALQ